MTREFPLVGIELLRLSRKRSIYGIRMGVVGLMFAVLLLLSFVTSSFGSSASDTEMIGIVIRVLVGAVIMGASFLLPLLRATDAFSIEKRDGTLPILLLASTSLADIVLAKMAIILLECCVLLLAVMPLYAFGMYFGGITLGSILTDLSGAVASATEITAVGLYFSAACRSVLAARVYTIGFSMLTSLAFLFICVFFLGMTFAELLLMASSLTLTVSVVPIIVGILVAGLAFAGTVHKLKKLTVLAPSVRPLARRNKKHTKSQSRDPLSAIIRGGVLGLGMRDYRIGLRILAVLVFSLVAFMPGLGSLVIILILYWDTVGSLDSLRSSGALDDVRVVPVTDAQLSRSIYRALFNGGGAYLIALVLGPLALLFVSQYLADSVMVWAIVLTIISATAKYVAVIALAAYWGVAHGQKRFAGVFTYFLVSFGGAVVGWLINILALAQWMTSTAPLMSTGVFSLGTLLPAFALFAIAFMYARLLGARWRADLSPGRRKLPPEVLAHLPS